MNQLEIGTFIAKKRKENNYTQMELAERLGVSNKTISKWETGKCMPDYSVIEVLCKELGISISELMDGEEASPDSIRAYDDEQILDLIKRIQNLENQRTSLYGIILIVMGMTLFAMHSPIGGTPLTDFIAGVMMGISIGAMLVGVYVAVSGVSKLK